jgi:outer membrane protein assembly factor BamE (lipoprotein component of BamABCDE complex)
MMTQKRLALIAAVSLAIAAVMVGVLVMLPPGPGVTKANFDRIEKGMTKAKVEEIFGLDAT